MTARVHRLRPRMDRRYKETRDPVTMKNMKYRRDTLKSKLGLNNKELTREQRLNRVADLLVSVVEEEALLIGATANYMDIVAQGDEEVRTKMLRERNQCVKLVLDILNTEKGLRNMAKNVGEMDARDDLTDPAALERSNKKDEQVNKVFEKAMQLLEESSLQPKELDEKVSNS